MVVLVEEARQELRALPMRENPAIVNALLKLESGGQALGFPHSSAIEGASDALRELRPRAGRSPWRAFYRRVGDEFVVGAIGPEASVDPQGFRRAVDAAIARLGRYERDA